MNGCFAISASILGSAAFAYLASAQPMMTEPGAKATAAEKVVSQETMKAIYEEVKTPHKVGMVLLPEKDECLDDPAVFRHGDAWYMTVVRYVNKGYETHLAKSADPTVLLGWQRYAKNPVLRPSDPDARAYRKRDAAEDRRRVGDVLLRLSVASRRRVRHVRLLLRPEELDEMGRRAAREAL